MRSKDMAADSQRAESANDADSQRLMVRKAVHASSQDPDPAAGAVSGITPDRPWSFPDPPSGTCRGIVAGRDAALPERRPRRRRAATARPDPGRAPRAVRAGTRGLRGRARSAGRVLGHRPRRRLPLAAGDRSGARGALRSPSWEPGDATIISRARDVAGIFEALNLWRTVRRHGGVAAATDCASLDEAIERVVAEVADTYPAFELRGLDWDAICERRLRAPSGAPTTRLRPPGAGSPSSRTRTRGSGRATRISRTRSRVELDAVRFTHVPGRVGRRSRPASGRAGCWRRSTSSPPTRSAGWRGPPRRRTRARALAGRRLLAGPAGVPRLLTATDAAGHRVSWEEEPTTGPLEPVVDWRRLDSAHGYLRIAAWRDDVDDAVDAALRRAPRLRDADRRPAPESRRQPRRRLPHERPLPPHARRRSARSATASAAASLASRRRCSRSRQQRALAREARRPHRRAHLLLERGLPARAAGARARAGGRSPSGGGSGRPRHLRLLPGWSLTVSTALTYDRDGRCVEGAGLPVDVPVPPVLRRRRTSRSRRPAAL